MTIHADSSQAQTSAQPDKGGQAPHPDTLSVTEGCIPEPLDRDPRVRLEYFFDPGTLQLLTDEDDSGMLSGFGTVDGQSTVAFASDPRLQGGAMGDAGCKAILVAYEYALNNSLPIVGLWASGGARLREGVLSLNAVGEVFFAMTRASGKIPQISLVLGPAAGGAAYGPALTDVVVLAPEGRVFVTGPDVVRSVTGEQVTAERLGGGEPHGRKSGVVHVVADSLTHAYDETRKLVTLLARPAGVHHDVEDVDLGRHFPAAKKRAYDIRPMISDLLDSPIGEGAIELHTKWAPNITTTLGRLGGHTVGIIANNPIRLGGCLDSLSAEKSARFVRMCDSLGIPLIVIVDVPGYLPGVGQEWDGVVRRGAKLLHAFAESSVPRFTLVTRKSYGGAYIAMNGRSLGATHVLAWPEAEVAVMGAVAAVRILNRRQLAAVSDDEKPALEEKLAAEHEIAAGGLQRAQEIGVVDETINPAKTRRRLAELLASHPIVRGDHSNIPL